MIQVRNPRTGDIDFTFEDTSPDQIAALTKRMREAQIPWQSLGYDGRANALMALADAIARHAPSITEALMTDTGRKKLAIGEVQGAVGALKGWCERRPDKDLPDEWVEGRAFPNLRHKPQFSPYPLVGVISPWNFPLTLSMIDAMPALLAGCAVIIKPSEITPRFATPLRAAISEIPELTDILCIVDGAVETGKAIVNHVDAICFTGSIATGRKVALAAAERLIPAFLELGGKDPLIVTEGADIERATDAALRGSVAASGQACQSIERIYVARPIYSDFTTLLARKADAAPLNHLSLDAGVIGPIIFGTQAGTIERHMTDALAKGARQLTSKTRQDQGGVWIRPTVLADVDHSMKIMTEETFGPLMPVHAFDTIDEAVALANDTVFGLSGAVFAANLEEAEAIGRRLDVGAVSLNDAALTALFFEAEKHAFKQSGLGGSRMGPAGFHRFLRRKALIANTTTPIPLSAFAEDSET
ncbi:MAG: aldehyde dehydrogenase family protein [Pseudomonadota bacterium]